MYYKLEDIEEVILDSGSDSLKVFGGKFEGGIYSQQMSDELAKCIFAIMYSKKTLDNYLEIGTASGGTLYLMNYFFDFDKIVFIDDNCHGRSKIRDDILDGVQYTAFIGNSQSAEIHKKVKSLDVKFDIIMIDGDHSYEGVKVDFEYYKSFLADDGFLIFHDTVHEACPGVRQFVSELKEDKNYKLIGEFISTRYSYPCGLALFQKQEVVEDLDE